MRIGDSRVKCKPRVAVLLSTYNGEQFLKQQIASVISQKNVLVDLFVRDDGSSDSTTNILLDYIKPSQIIKGENIGVWRSFLDLIKSVNVDYDYFALCDQDDYWLDEKLGSAINMIKMQESNNLPVLYCSALWIVKNNLRKVRVHSISPDKINFRSAIIQNAATGNTIVLNVGAFSLFKELPIPRYCIMHDWWMYLVVLGVGGRVVYDEEPKVFYRQHEDNVLGMTDNIELWKNTLIDIYKGRSYVKCCLQATSLYDLAENKLTKSNKKILLGFLDEKRSLYEKLKYILSGELTALTPIRGLVIKLGMLTKR